MYLGYECLIRLTFFYLNYLESHLHIPHSLLFNWLYLGGGGGGNSYSGWSGPPGTGNYGGNYTTGGGGGADWWGN